MSDIVERLRENVAEQLNESAGYWHSCSGCHETVDGYSIDPVDPVFRCVPGGGCRECGGIGVVWDNIDYDDFVKFNVEEDRKADEIAQLRTELDTAMDQAEEAITERDDLLQVFNIQWAADQRAIERWREAHPGSEMIWPDRGDMVVWLMDQFDRAGPLPSQPRGRP